MIATIDRFHKPSIQCGKNKYVNLESLKMQIDRRILKVINLSRLASIRCQQHKEINSVPKKDILTQTVEQDLEFIEEKSVNNLLSINEGLKQDLNTDRPSNYQNSESDKTYIQRDDSKKNKTKRSRNYRFLSCSSLQQQSLIKTNQTTQSLFQNSEWGQSNPQILRSVPMKSSYPAQEFSFQYINIPSFSTCKGIKDLLGQQNRRSSILKLSKKPLAKDHSNRVKMSNMATSFFKEKASVKRQPLGDLTKGLNASYHRECLCNPTQRCLKQWRKKQNKVCVSVACKEKMKVFAHGLLKVPRNQNSQNQLRKNLLKRLADKDSSINKD